MVTLSSNMLSTQIRKLGTQELRNNTVIATCVVLNDEAARRAQPGCQIEPITRETNGFRFDHEQK